MAKKKKARQKEPKMNGQVLDDNHVLDDNGAYLPTVQEIWGKGGLTEQFRHDKLYPAWNRTRKLSKTAETIIRTDSQGLPAAD